MRHGDEVLALEGFSPARFLFPDQARTRSLPSGKTPPKWFPTETKSYLHFGDPEHCVSGAELQLVDFSAPA